MTSLHLQQILKLVRTYQLPNWRYSQLPELNPYFLASLGYQCSGPRTIKCHICQHQIIITDQLEQQPALLLQMLKQHDQNCIYNGVQPSQISAKQVYVALGSIIEQKEAVAFEEGYPLINSKSLQQFLSTNKFMVNKILKLYGIDQKQFVITFFLKMLGWRLTKSEGEYKLVCQFCGQEILLSQLKTVPLDKHDVQLQKNTAQERLFDPVDSHRYFCSWVGGPRFWQVYLQHQQDKFSQLTSFRFKTTPLQTHRMRNHIDKYLLNAREKIEGGLEKLRTITEDWGGIFQKLAQDKHIDQEEKQGELKRMRQFEEQVNEAGEVIGQALDHPLKKIKLD